MLCSTSIKIVRLKDKLNIVSYKTNLLFLNELLMKRKT